MITLAQPAYERTSSLRIRSTPDFEMSGWDCGCCCCCGAGCCGVVVDDVDGAAVALVLVFVDVGVGVVAVVVVVDLKNFDAIVDGSDFDVSVVLVEVLVELTDGLTK